MARIIEITGLNDPSLAPYVRLTEAQLRSRRDPENARFIAESPVVIGHALDAGCEPVSLLMERRHLEGQGKPLMDRCGDIPVYTGESALLEQLTGFRLTRGILCAMRRPAPRSPEEICRNARRVAVLEDIVDPTNVGAILRSAAALNVDALLLSPGCCDPLHRRAVRVSMGTVFQIPWAYLGSREEWPEASLGRLKSMGFHAAAMALSDEALSIEDPSLAARERLAILLGTEGTGLREETIRACDDCVMIPMSHGVDSLNVAAASAVAFWQLCREKR